MMSRATGNMLADGVYSYAYNAESEIKSAAGVNYTGVYPERSRRNGDGNRLEKSSGKIYWPALSEVEGYGAGTEILDESDSSGNFTNEYVFFGGKRVAMRVVSSGTVRLLPQISCFVFEATAARPSVAALQIPTSADRSETAQSSLAPA